MACPGGTATMPSDRNWFYQCMIDLRCHLGSVGGGCGWVFWSGCVGCLLFRQRWLRRLCFLQMVAMSSGGGVNRSRSPVGARDESPPEGVSVTTRLIEVGMSGFNVQLGLQL